MKAVYLIPCTCGNKVRVDAGQAGAKVSCSCGNQISVPTFRALRDLELETPLTPAVVSEPRRWSAGRGILFSVGLLVSVIAAVLVCYHFYSFWEMRDGGESFKQEYIETFRHDVEHLTPFEALHEFSQHVKDGLEVQGTPPWAKIEKMRDDSFRWLVGAGIALAFGLVSMFGALLVPSPDRSATKSGI